jgi:hypothetical protein
VTREVKDRSTGTVEVPADYSRLGWLLIMVALIGVVAPLTFCIDIGRLSSIGMTRLRYVITRALVVLNLQAEAPRPTDVYPSQMGLPLTAEPTREFDANV